jgi:hypothetical protein
MEIQIGFPTTGGQEFLFGRARHAATPAPLTFVAAVLAGFIWLMVVESAPLLFIAVFGLFEILLLVMTWGLWFKRTRLSFGGDTVQIENDYLLCRARQSIPMRDLQDFRIQIGMQAGNQPYYDIRLILSDGRSIRAGTMVRNKREAEWIAAEMKRASGVR